MEEQHISEEQKYHTSRENELTGTFGPPEVREQETSDYINDLITLHGLPLIRQILTALSEIEGFIPAESLKIALANGTPLESQLRPFDIPWFYFERVEVSGSHIEVDVSDGVPMAASGSTYAFEIVNGDFRFLNRKKIWIS